jgi:hypothetical protein
MMPNSNLVSLGPKTETPGNNRLPTGSSGWCHTTQTSQQGISPSPPELVLLFLTGNPSSALRSLKQNGPAPPYNKWPYKHLPPPTRASALGGNLLRAAHWGLQPAPCCQRLRSNYKRKRHCSHIDRSRNHPPSFHRQERSTRPHPLPPPRQPGVHPLSRRSTHNHGTGLRTNNRTSGPVCPRQSIATILPWHTP